MRTDQTTQDRQQTSAAKDEATAYATINADGEAAKGDGATADTGGDGEAQQFQQ